MKNNKLNWYIVNKKYINYLRNFDNKVQNIDYNSSSKPYIGIIFNINNFNYYVPISSVKSKHYFMSNNIDFFKIIENKKILSVINLNNMIPISENSITKLNYSNIPNHFSFENESSKFKYIALLRKELSIINNQKEDLLYRAQKLYKIKSLNPSSNIAMRCCNFKLLEEKCVEYEKLKESSSFI